MMNILSLNKISHAFGGPKLLEEADLHIESGDRICLLGRNGRGKSTMLHLNKKNGGRFFVVKRRAEKYIS